MPTDSEIEKQIIDKGLTAPRIKPEDIDNAIVGEQYHRFEGTNTVVCCLTIQGGFNTIGHSSCVSDDNFDADIGKSIARKIAKDQIWMLKGFELSQKIHTEKKDIERETK